MMLENNQKKNQNQVFHFRLIGVHCRPAWSKPSCFYRAKKEYDPKCNFGLAQ